MATTVHRSFRLPADVIEVLERQPNSTEYVVEAVRRRAREDRSRAIAEGLQCLALDDEANDVSDFAEAQRAVMARGD